MATLFTIMSYGGMALAVASLILAVVLFVKWNIPKVFGDISGHTEKKAIERIRQEGYDVNASKKVSLSPSGITGRIKIRKTESEELISRDVEPQEQITDTMQKAEANQETAINQESAITKDVNTRTTVLSSTSMEETTVLGAKSGEEETTVLSMAPREDATTVLAEGNVDGVIHISDEVITPPGTVTKVLDFIVTHTEDVIA